MGYSVSKDVFGEVVQKALDTLPEPYAEFVRTLRIEVRDRPTRQMLREVGLAQDELLLGLYQGRPQTLRSVEDSAVLPDVIYLFQDDLQEICQSREELVDEIQKTVLHEIGHHFGLGEKELDDLGFA